MAAVFRIMELIFANVKCDFATKFTYVLLPICSNRAPTGLLMKRLSRQPLFPSRTFKSMEEIPFCLFGRIFHGSIHFYGFKKERLDFKEWNWLVSWKTRIEDLFGGRGGGCFYWLNNKHAFCLAEIWPLSSILGYRFYRKPKRFALWRGYVRAQRDDLLCYRKIPKISPSMYKPLQI